MRPAASGRDRTQYMSDEQCATLLDRVDRLTQ